MWDVPHYKGGKFKNGYTPTEPFAYSVQKLCLFGLKLKLKALKLATFCSNPFAHVGLALAFEWSLNSHEAIYCSNPFEIFLLLIVLVIQKCCSVYYKNTQFWFKMAQCDAAFEDFFLSKSTLKLLCIKSSDHTLNCTTWVLERSEDVKNINFYLKIYTQIYIHTNKYQVKLKYVII